MKTIHLLVAHAVMAAALILAAAEAADAQQGGGRPDIPVPVPPIQRVYVVERVVVLNADPPAEAKSEEPAAKPPEPPAPPAPAEPPRKPYAVGETYASLPGGCMKLIDGGVSYYNCGGEWYRKVGDGQYKAVSQP